MKITEDIHFYPWESFTQNNCNSILITGEVKTLIDPGHNAPFPQLAAQLKQDGADLSELDLIINTHSHPDHFEASQDLARQYGMRVALHPQGEEYLQKMGPMFSRAMAQDAPTIHIDLHLVEGELELGSRKILVYHTPGHSPGSICLYLPAEKVLISGDLFFASGVGRYDFPGGSGAELKKSIERMSELEIEAVLPGHGPMLSGRDMVERNFQLIREFYFPMLQ